MKKILTVQVLILSIFLFIGAHALASAPEWMIDKDHSSFNFGVKHIYSTIWGHFDDYSGTFLFDPNDLAESKIAFRVQVKSVQTHVAKRDNHLRTADFFDAEKFPLITFESTGINYVGGNKYDVAGRLTIKDVTESIVLPFIFYGIKDHPASPKDLVAGFETSLKIDRLQYHVGSGKFFKMGLVGRDVDIVVYLELLRNKK